MTALEPYWSDEKQRIGTRVKAARKAAGLSTRQLAEIVGILQTSICNIEAGRFRPARETADLIAAAVGVEVSAFICIDGVPGEPLNRRGPRGSSWSAEYFWQRVDKRGPDECWPWTRALNGKGYGHVTFRGESTGAHRVAYELSIGPIADGLEIDHTCHDPDACQALGNDCPHRCCCNPAHLKPVTHVVNMRRGGSRPGRPGRPGRGGGRPPALNPGLTVNQRFGLYLCTARKKAGLTRDELGEMVGLAGHSMCQIESGKRGTTAARRAAFIAALNLDLEDLLRYLNSGPAAVADPLFDLEDAS